eukprot:jgi/Pico_ML_1/51655/g231.t1
MGQNSECCLMTFRMVGSVPGRKDTGLNLNVLSPSNDWITAFEQFAQFSKLYPPSKATTTRPPASSVIMCVMIP